MNGEILGIDERGVVLVTPDYPGAMTCGDPSCGRSWDDTVSTGVTPAPSGRCPFEAEHDQRWEDPATDQEWFVTYTDEEGDPGSVIGPFVSPEEANDWIASVPGAIRFSYSDLQVRGAWPPDEWIVSRLELVDEYDNDPDGGDPAVFNKHTNYPMEETT